MRRVRADRWAALIIASSLVASAGLWDPQPAAADPLPVQGPVACSAGGSLSFTPSSGGKVVFHLNLDGTCVGASGAFAIHAANDTGFFGSGTVDPSSLCGPAGFKPAALGAARMTVSWGSGWWNQFWDFAAPSARVGGFEIRPMLLDQYGRPTVAGPLQGVGALATRMFGKCNLATGTAAKVAFTVDTDGADPPGVPDPLALVALPRLAAVGAPVREVAEASFGPYPWHVIVRPDGAGWYEAVFEAAGCSEVDPIPRTGWAVAPDLSSAELSVETSCGSLHAVWRAAGFPEQNDLVERWGTFSSNFGSSDPAAGGNYAVITIGVGG